MGEGSSRPDTKLERMKADYLLPPTSLVRRLRRWRAERWLVYYTVGPIAQTLEDTRPQSAEARAKWRRWRASQLGQLPDEIGEPRPAPPRGARYPPS